MEKQVKKQLRYNISYLWTGGERHVTGLSWFLFVQHINAIDEDAKAIPGTVRVETVEVEV